MQRILVVDDDVDILTVVQITLEANGFKVRSISKWQKIFETIEPFNPDLILLDVSLGNQDGRNLCKQIKSNPLTKGISIILFSANNKVTEQLHECMADGFIGKPFDINDLIQGINNELLEPNGNGFH